MFFSMIIITVINITIAISVIIIINIIIKIIRMSIACMNVSITIFAIIIFSIIVIIMDLATFINIAITTLLLLSLSVINIIVCFCCYHHYCFGWLLALAKRISGFQVLLLFLAFAFGVCTLWRFVSRAVRGFQKFNSKIALQKGAPSSELCWIPCRRVEFDDQGALLVPKCHWSPY